MAGHSPCEIGDDLIHGYAQWSDAGRQARCDSGWTGVYWIAVFELACSQSACLARVECKNDEEADCVRYFSTVSMEDRDDSILYG
jgi:hypothetical protein